MRIDNSFFTQRRNELINRIPEGSAVFLFAGKARAMSQDTNYRFLPDRNFYYLTGLMYEDGRLVLVKDKDGAVKTMLFALKKDDYIERWHGKRMTFDEVSSISGIDVEDIFDVNEFDERIYPFHGNLRFFTDETSISDEASLFMAMNDGCEDIGPVLTKMRMVKSEDEINAIIEAARITEQALDEMKTFIREGVSELELYTKLEYEMGRRGSLIPAFETIVSIGENSFYLHHGDPEDETGVLAKKGDVIQIDVGARCMGYCADISRVYFVGDPDDKEALERRTKLLGLIRDLRKNAFGFIKPGESFNTLNELMRKITGETLFSWGLLPEGYTDEDVRGYYWHNTSHHLGLDVHDISIREDLFVKGNCLAVEPGVYIKEWGIGFRIEDDVLVTEDGCRLLSSGIDSDESVMIKGI